LAEIKKSVLPFGLQRDHISSEVLLNASGEIQKQINEVLRPLSHRLWVNGLGRIKHRNLLGLLKDAVLNLDFSVKHILFYQFFVGGYGISLVLGLKSAIFVSSIGMCTSILLIRTFYFLRPKANTNLFPLGLGFLILIGLLPVFIPIAIRNPLSESASVLAGLLVSPTIPGLILLVSSYRLISRDRDFAIGAASSVGFRISSLNKSLIGESSGIELAQYFHNSLQSELYGISKQLESSSKDMKNENARGILDSLDRALSRKYDEISSDNFDAVKRIDNLIDSWRGIAEILIAGTETIANNLILAHTTSQILEEMITNAIRYGQADKIEITLEIENLELLIILKHNGNGEISKKSGLGTLLLAQYSESGLTIETKNGYTYLRLNVPAGEVGSSDHS
jgi:two-component sensor histidine kinase